MTVVEARPTHEWKLAGPWWTWPKRSSADPTDPGSPQDRRAVRLTRPTIQKYDSPDLVNTFLRTPQTRLEYDPEVDLVWNVTSTGFGKLPKREKTDRLKLYLASHHRHYLVVCSLRCDVAGFPHSRREDVCEAGMVVRRRRTDLPGGPDGDLARALRRHAAARGKKLEVQRRLASLAERPSRRLRSATLQARLDSLAAAEDSAAGDIREHWGPQDDVRVLEGWIPTGVDATGTPSPMPACPSGSQLTPVAGIGSWQPVDELPAELTEASYSLSPLVADPTKPDHDGTGESIYFGVVPTGSSDLDDRGNARFEDHSVYEIRCFVRRHRVECPRSGGHCTCPLTWSEPTTAYQLAGHFDLQGTANRPVTVQMPDLAQLHADSVRLSPGGAGGVRFQSPPESELAFTAEDTKATKAAGAPNPGFQICSFAIPLITIVAFFVLRLFLPIVVLVFQLWFLLTLRFCIPPDVSIDAGLTAKLDAIGGGVDIDAGAVVAIEADASFQTALDGLLGGTKVVEGGGVVKTLAQKLREARAGGSLDTQSFGSIARGALAAGPATPRPRTFARRVERWEVVEP